MRKVNALLFASLDGFASDRAQEMRWVTDGFGDEQARYGLDQHRAWDALVLGRVTYQQLAGYWPAASPEQDGEFVEVMNTIPKIVFSRTLQAEDVTWNNARLNTGEAVKEIYASKLESGGDIGIVGSVELVRSLMRFGLIDRLTLQVHPVVLGADGRKPVFGEHDQRALRLVGSRTLDSRVAMLDYAPA